MYAIKQRGPQNIKYAQQQGVYSIFINAEWAQMEHVERGIVMRRQCARIHMGCATQKCIGAGKWWKGWVGWKRGGRRSPPYLDRCILPMARLQALATDDLHHKYARAPLTYVCEVRRDAMRCRVQSVWQRRRNWGSTPPFWLTPPHSYTKPPLTLAHTHRNPPLLAILNLFLHPFWSFWRKYSPGNRETFRMQFISSNSLTNLHTHANAHTQEKNKMCDSDNAPDSHIFLLL